MSPEPALPVSQPSPIQLLVEICEQNHSRWTYCEVAQVRQLLDQAAERDRELQQARETNRELNRRVQSLDNSLARETGKKAWYGYFQAASQLYGQAEKSLSEARDEIARLKEAFTCGCENCRILRSALHPVPEKPKS